MDRKQFLKTCAGGLCLCSAARVVPTAAGADSPAAPADDWRLPFVKKRYAQLLEILGVTVSAETRDEILRQLGRHCASLYPPIQEHRGDVDGFITEFKQRAHEDIQYDREKGIVTVVGPERGDCFCPLVDRQKTPACVCNCSLGWQQFTYETLLGRKRDGGTEGIGRARRQALRLRDPGAARDRARYRPRLTMPTTRLTTLCLCASALLSARSLTAAPTESPTARHGVPVPFSEVVPLHCTSNDRDYDLFIRYPDGYLEEKNRDRRYPIIYICDAQWDFFLISGIYPTLVFDEKIDEAILVGMAWGGKTSNYWQYRGIDYTPAPVANNPEGGGAARFLAALKAEIIPFVEARVRCDPARRVLTGSSYGGLFVLFTLLNEPELFFGYIAPTPALVYADNGLARMEAATAGKRQAARGKLFMTAGGLESPAWQNAIFEFQKALESRRNAGLKIETLVIEGEGHSGQKAEAYTRGLRYVFRK
jgi:predicted alpha/beta superfamily hydrolase